MRYEVSLLRVVDDGLVFRKTVSADSVDNAMQEVCKAYRLTPNAEFVHIADCCIIVKEIRG